MKYLPLLMLLFIFNGCKKDGTIDPPEANNQPNILLIIADDMGKDATSGFSEGSIKPNTPVLDQLQNEGLRFDNVWVNPSCSPTRASIITGKYGYRTGVKWAGDELNNSEKILHQYISDETNDAYATAIIGKWHLSGDDTSVDPEIFGLDYYAGLIRGGVQDYYGWQLTENGSGSLQTEYATKVFTDLSIDWINSQSKPWFLWLAYNAPHTPFHVPPSEMHAQGELPEYEANLDATPYYMAAIEALDYQIGQLLEGIPSAELENTIIIFMGDNGTPIQVAQAPYSNSKAKGSLYQGGVNVPMFVSGAGLSRTGIDNNLITSTDLFSTIAEIAGSDQSEIQDSKSFKSLLTNTGSHRNFQYSEKDDGDTDQWAISNGIFKLLVDSEGNQEMYKLNTDPYENEDLLNGTLTTEQASAKAELEAELFVIRD